MVPAMDRPMALLTGHPLALRLVLPMDSVLESEER
jgi:hypothetical protein